MKSNAGSCPQCNQMMKEDCPEGLCPHCLLVRAAPVEGDPTGSLPAQAKGRFRAPHPDELNGQIDGIEINELLGVSG